MGRRARYVGQDKSRVIYTQVPDLNDWQINSQFLYCNLPCYITVTPKYYHWDKSAEVFFNLILYCLILIHFILIQDCRYIYFSEIYVPVYRMSRKPVQHSDWHYNSKVVWAVTIGKYLKDIFVQSRKKKGKYM